MSYVTYTTSVQLKFSNPKMTPRVRPDSKLKAKIGFYVKNWVYKRSGRLSNFLSIVLVNEITVS